MSKPLTVIMPFLNEGDQVRATLDSLYATARSDMFSVIAIDDNSTEQIDLSGYPDVTTIRHNRRWGVDGSRHQGIQYADTEYLFIIDAHMRFPDDRWMERLIKYLVTIPKSILSTTCMSLGYGIDHLKDATSKYKGATLCLISKEPERTSTGELKAAREVIEGKWLTQDKWPPEPVFDVACVMGATYAFSKRWYNHLHGLEGLQQWGSSEPYLSVKSWLAGGTCKCITDIEIGHFFRDHSPYATTIWSLVYNKLLMMSVLFPQELSEKLIPAMPQDVSFELAYKKISENNVWITEERAYFDSIKKHDMQWYIDKFGIAV